MKKNAIGIQFLVFLAMIMMPALGRAYQLGSNPKNIKIGDVTYNMFYEAGRLKWITYNKLDISYAYLISYPENNKIQLQFGGIVQPGNKFEPLTSRDIQLFGGNFNSTEYMLLNGTSKQIQQTRLNKEGELDLSDNKYISTYKWSGNSVSKIDSYGDSYKFKYYDRGFDINANDWNWLGFIMARVIGETSIDDSWCLGSLFYLFHKFPKEVETVVNGKKATYVFEYYPTVGSQLIEIKRVVNGSMTNRINVNITF